MDRRRLKYFSSSSEAGSDELRELCFDLRRTSRTGASRSKSNGDPEPAGSGPRCLLLADCSDADLTRRLEAEQHVNSLFCALHDLAKLLRCFDAAGAGRQGPLLWS